MVLSAEGVRKRFLFPSEVWDVRLGCVVLRSESAVAIAKRGLLLSSIGSVLFVGLLTRLKLLFKASLDKA